MFRATSILPAGSWTGAPSDTVLLDFDARHRRRLAMSAKGGVSFFFDLPVAAGLRHGDGLLLEDGRIIAVEAAVEPLLDISAGGHPPLVHIAWHLGNLQLPTQMMGDHLRIRPHPAVEAMLAELGATIRPVEAPFDPERGIGDDEGPWAGFGWDTGPGLGQSDFGSSTGHGRNRTGGSFHSGSAFSQAYGNAHASGHSRQSHSSSHSHAGHAPREDKNPSAEAPEPNPDDSRFRPG